MITIKIICANDSMELAFLPDTPKEIIQAEILKIKDKMDKLYPSNSGFGNNSVYVHIHEVKLYEKIPK